MAYKSKSNTEVEYLRAPSPSLTVTSNYTMMCWVYVDTTSTKGNFFYVGADQNGAGDGFGFSVGNTTPGSLGNNFIFQVFPVVNFNTTQAIGTGWHHLAVADRNGSQHFYFDGNFVISTDTADIGGAPDDFTWIGEDSDPTAGNNLGDGINDNRVAHVKMWNVALGTTQIQTEMNTGFPIFGYNDGSLAMYWALEKSGQAGLENNGIDYTQKFTAVGSAVTGPSFADNPPVARC